MSVGLQLISAIILAGSASVLNGIDRDRMLDAELPAFDFVFQHYRQYREMPAAATVQTETTVRLPQAPEALNFYVDQVENRYLFNTIRDSYAEMRDHLRTGHVDPLRPIVDDMHRVLSTQREHGQRVSGIGAALGEVTARLERTQGYGGITGIETPWAGFNEITGGYQNADLITIVGRPGVAKTYNLLCQAMGSHAAGHPTLFVTTEMSIEQLARRYASLRLGINPELLKRNMVSTYMMNRIRALSADMLEDDTFRLFSVGMGAKLSVVENLLQEFGPSICYIDGTYLMHPSIKTQMKRIERVAEVFDELKGLTISANIPIVNTMQFNRQAGKDGKDGSLENIGFTDAVGMHSSIVVGLGYGPTENPRASRTMNFLKGREGEVGEVHHNFRFAPVDMSELIMLPGQNADGTPAPEGAVDVDWMV